MKIFTFWEPAGRVPGYIAACMRTWKNLPDAEVVLLDYASLYRYLSPELAERLTCRKLSMPKQVDVYRAALLEKWGGVWLDADTIITPAVRELGVFDGDAEVTTFSQPAPDQRLTLAGAFFCAREPHTRFFREWASVMPSRVARYVQFCRNPLLRVLKRPEWRLCRSWDYCLNAVIDPLALTMSPGELRVFPLEEMGAFPELTGGRLPMAEFWAQYNRFYFEPGSAEGVLDHCKGMVLLHNSWTPKNFYEMDEPTFLRQDIRLVRILNKLDIA